jgi:hypothetical protein
MGATPIVKQATTIVTVAPASHPLAQYQHPVLRQTMLIATAPKLVPLVLPLSNGEIPATAPISIATGTELAVSSATGRACDGAMAE